MEAANVKRKLLQGLKRYARQGEGEEMAERLTPPGGAVVPQEEGEEAEGMEDLEPGGVDGEHGADCPCCGGKLGMGAKEVTLEDIERLLSEEGIA